MKRKPMRFGPRAVLLFAGPALWIGCAHVGPLVAMARISVADVYPVAPGAGAGLTLAHYAAFVASRAYPTALLRSLGLAAAITALALVVTYPLAHRIAFHVAPERRLRELMLLVAPFWTSEIVRTYGIVLLLARRGAVNTALAWSGLSTEPLPLLYGPVSLGLGMLYAVMATMLVPLYAALERIPPDLLEAAEGLGAGSWRRLAFVTIPLARGGIASGCALVFLVSLGAFAVPMLLGGASTTLLPMTIADLFGSGIGRWPTGAAFSLILLGVGVALAAALARLGRIGPGPR